MAEEYSSSFQGFPQSDTFDEDSDLNNCIACLQCTDKEGRDNHQISIYPGREIQVGRDSACNHLIPDTRVSKRHFRIYSIIYEAGRTDLPPLVYCEDLESSNGTYVNGSLIGIIGQERKGFLLNDGDIIQIRPGWNFQFHQSVHDIVTRDYTELSDLQCFQDRFSVSDRILGQGSYGAVYLALDLSQDLASKKQVACKIINLTASGEKHMEQRPDLKAGDMWHNQLRRANEGRNIALREIKILSKLSHPHIINLKKAFCTTTSLYMITELAPGGDLFSYLEAYHGHLDDWHGRVVARQLALAIDYLHSQGIAHRDIKPENVLVSHTDFGGRVILTDFGFANVADARTGRLQSVVGTPGFAAPEVEANEHRKGGYTLAADLWSLGVLTACVLTGNSLIPYKELSQLSQTEIANRFLEISDDYIRDQWLSMGPRAQRFLRRLLTADPVNRMTVKEALNHSWFKKPHSEATLLEERYHKIIRFWKKRDSDDQVIEYLPSWNQTPEAEQEKGPRFRRKFPDATLSPYFNLDRHLTQKRPATRGDVLVSLLESGSSFVPTKEFRHKPAAQLATLKHRDMDVIVVDGKDMFGTSRETEALNPIDDYDEMVLVPTESMPHLENLNLQSPAKSTEVPDSQETVDDDEDQGRMTKRARKESWDPEDRRIHEAASLVIPRYASARVFRDTIQQRKEAERLENMRPSLYAM